MMFDIFSTFDPSMYMYNNMLNWLPGLLIFISLIMGFHLSTYWSTPTLPNTWLNLMSSWIFNLSLSTLSYKFKFHTSLLISLYCMISMFNYIGLRPYMFSLSSHMVFCLSLGLTLWMIMMISVFSKTPYKFMASLLPLGTPLLLAPFLAMVELISTLIAPLTLSFRLMANMTSGHIILSLISSISTKLIVLFNPYIILILPIQIFYFMFEMMICFIQTYIFCLLITLYLNNHPKI